LVEIGKAIHIHWNESVDGSAVLTLFEPVCDATYQPVVMMTSSAQGIITINSG